MMNVNWLKVLMIVVSMAATEMILADELNLGQAQFFNDQQRQEQEKELLKPKLEIIPDSALPSDKKPEVVTDTSCIPFSGIEIEGITLLSTQSIVDFMGPLEKLNCLPISRLNALYQFISTAYLKAGYLASQPLQYTQKPNGRIVIPVAEGKLEQVQATKQWIYAPEFKATRNGVLNIYEIEQSLDQLNRLPSNQIKVDIAPGSEYATSVIKLNDARTTAPKRSTLNLSIDNYGVQNRASLYTAFDNPLHLNDQVFVQYSDILEDRMNPNKTGSIGYSLARGRTLWSGYASYTKSEQLVNQTKTSRSDYVSEQLNAELSWYQMLFRNKRYIVTGNTSLAYTDLETNFHSTNVLGTSVTELSISSPQITTARAGIDISRYTAASTTIINLGAEKGLPENWGTRDKDASTDEQYLFMNSSVTHQRPITRYLMTGIKLSGQYSEDKLPNIAQMAVGGTLTVPGFRDYVYSGNTVAVASLFARYQLPSIKQYYHTVQLTAYGGSVHGDENNVAVDLSSCGLGYNGYWGKLSAQLAYAYPISISRANVEKEGDFTFRVSLAY